MSAPGSAPAPNAAAAALVAVGTIVALVTSRLVGRGQAIRLSAGGTGQVARVALGGSTESALATGVSEADAIDEILLVIAMIMAMLPETDLRRNWVLAKPTASGSGLRHHPTPLGRTN